MELRTLQEAASQYGTPTYLFDLDKLSQRMETLRLLLGNRPALCFAMKANPFLSRRPAGACRQV